MTARTLQAIVGVIFIVSHFAVLILVAAFYIARGFTFEEMTTTIAIVAPVFAGYTLIIVRAIMAERTQGNTAPQKNERFLFIFLSLFVPAVFVLVLVAIICLRAYNVGISSFEQFKTMLALAEGVFAVYLGPIIQALFSAGKQEGEASVAATAATTSETTR
jgi:hypothetical protein